MLHTIPKLNAMLICDQIIVEAGTGKKSLIGIFENIGVSKFPCIHYLLNVYVKFTDAEGLYQFKLELVDLITNEVVGFGETPEVNLPDKLQSYDLPFTLRGINFKHPGKYEFRIYANKHLFGQKFFTVAQINPSKKPNDDQSAKN